MQIKYSAFKYTLPRLYKRKNKAYSKAFNTGTNFIVGYDVFIYRTHGMAGNIIIGNNVTIGDHCTIDYSGDLIIGDYVTISEGSRIFSHEHDITKIVKKESSAFPKKTIIGNNVWIGSGSTILAGVKVGDNVVIGAGSIVTKDVESNSVVAGNPARFIKSLQ